MPLQADRPEREPRDHQREETGGVHKREFVIAWRVVGDPRVGVHLHPNGPAGGKQLRGDLRDRG